VEIREWGKMMSRWKRVIFLETGDFIPESVAKVIVKSLVST
jgi:hypothetical protein